jgi:hypothetical protein
MKITDESGFQYSFGGADYVETTDFTFPNNYLFNYHTAWGLKKIESPYNEKIEFNYKTIHVGIWGFDRHEYLAVQDSPVLETFEEELMYFGGEFDDESRISVFKGDLLSFPPHTINTPYTNQLFIEEILTDKEKITFTRDANDYLLKKITIKDKAGNILKEIELRYKMENTHTLLDTLSIKQNSSVEKKYTFDYYGGSGNAIDQWGYYTYDADTYSGFNNDLFLHKEFAENSSNLKVKIGVNHYEALGIAMGNISQKCIDRKNEQNRIPNDYALKKIHFPTGGTTEYSYESNQYQYENTVFHGAGLRIKDIVSDPNDGQPKVITQFKYGQNENGNGIINFDRNIDEECFAKENFYFGEVKFDPWAPGSRCTLHKQCVDREVCIRCEDCGYINILYFFAQYATKIFSTHPLISEYANFSVFYNQVATYSKEENSTNTIGKIISEYETPVQYSTDEYFFPENPFLPYDAKMLYNDRVVSSYVWGEQPLLTSRKFLKNNNDTVKIETYSYGNPTNRIYSGRKVEQTTTAKQYSEIPNSCGWAGYKDIYCIVGSLFRDADYNITMNTKLLNAKTEKLFTDQGIVTTTENYEYNNKNQLMKTIVQNSNQGNFIKEYKYPWNYSTGIYPEMTSNNRLSPVIETITKQSNTEIGRVKTNYFKDPTKTNNLILPQTTQTSASGANNLRTDIIYDQYDIKGNILQYTGLDGISVSYLWSYGYQYPVAEIKNATYSQVQSALSALGLATSTLATSTSPDMTKVNNLRTSLPNAQITTYTYKPLVGIETIIDPRGVKVTYQYDNFNRLQKIVDDKGKTIQNYDYHYKNQ